MGSPPDEPCREAAAPDALETLHQVTLTHNFEMMDAEVTQENFLAVVLQRNPAQNVPCGLSCPVDQVSWHQAAAYCNALSDAYLLDPCYACTGQGNEVKCTPASSFQGKDIYSCPGYRLPTEAEWPSMVETFPRATV